jgi:chromosomal replication initiator protein
VQLIWEEFLKIIKEEAGSQIVETWFKAVSLEEWDAATSMVTLRAPNQFVSRWIQDHYTDLLKTHLARLLHTPISKLNFVCAQQNMQRPRNIIPASVVHEPTPDTPRPEQPRHYTSTKNTAIIPAKREEVIAVEKKTKDRNGNWLNENYHFDNFIVGASNSLAHAAAYAICENLGKVYNPLFIYGGTGLGKTHLLHAIGNEALKRDPTLNIRYETSDNFINEFINSIRFDRSPQFRNKYQKIDLILFDDIQFLSNKEQTQEIFFHIFNTFYEQQKQIVLSSDTFPKEITGLQSRLKSRMEWGLVADIQTPDIETKIAILKKKADVNTIPLPDDVAEFIASRVMSNIRELEGALIRVGAFAALTNQRITLEMAQRVLLNLNEPKKEGALLETILKIVAKHYDISINDIRSKKRHQDVALARQIAFYMMKKMSYCSLQAIGSYIGGRDHSTVIHAIGKVENLVHQDAALTQKLKQIEQEIMAS